MTLRKLLPISAMLMMTAFPALAANAYNNAMMRFEINDKGGDVQISGASAFAELGNKEEACKALANAADVWGYALKNLDDATAAPAAADDENRLSADEIEANRARIVEKRDKTLAIVNGTCAE